MDEPRPKGKMTWSFVGDVGVIVHGSATPTAAEWDSWLAEYRKRSSVLKGVVIYSFGGGPSSKQRTDLLKIVDKLQYVPQTVMVTSSTVARGIITAMSWFVAPAKRAQVFSLVQLEDAFAALGIGESARQLVYERISQMADDVDRPPAPMLGRSRF
jgi:hypothetical protein